METTKHIKKEKPNEVKLLTRKDILRLFDISYPTLLKWESENNWEFFRIKNKVFYREEYINEFINSKINQN